MQLRFGKLQQHDRTDQYACSTCLKTNKFPIDSPRQGLDRQEQLPANNWPLEGNRLGYRSKKPTAV